MGAPSADDRAKQSSVAIPPAGAGGKHLAMAQMKGMHRWLWEVFAGVVVAYCLYLSPRFVLWTAGIVFVGGAVLLTIVGYAAAKWSMPRPASFWLQLWYPDQSTEKMPPVRRFFMKIPYWPGRPKDSTG